MATATKKEYTIAVTSDRGTTRKYTGTLDYLIDDVFGYTLECNGMNDTFQRPTTITTLIKRLNGGLSYWSSRNSYELEKN